MTGEIARLERLVAHRELQLLRASALRTHNGKQWVRDRSRLLQEAQDALKRAQKRCAP